MSESRLFKHSTDPELAEKNMALLGFAGGLMGQIRPLLAEPLKVSGVEQVNDLKSPFLLMFNHDTRLDFVTLLDLWRNHTSQFTIRGVRREGILQPTALDEAIMGKLLKPIFAPPLIREGDDPHHQEKNRQALERIKADMNAGMNTVMAPTGTTKGNGDFPAIKSGAFKLSHVPREEGGYDLIDCVPLIATYDWMAGDRFLGLTRAQCLIAFGQPYTYEPLPKTEGRYEKRDLNAFAHRFKEEWANLNTVTTSQLAGYLFRKAKAADQAQFSYGELASSLPKLVERLQGETDRPPLIDPDLTHPAGQKIRLKNLYGRMQQKRYIDEKGTINYNRKVAEIKDYKTQLPLEYAANRLAAVMNYRLDIARAIKEA